MGLIKRNKEEEVETQAKPALRKSSIFRSGDFNQGTFLDKPPDEASDEDSDLPFEEGLPAAAAPAQGKVLGGRTHTQMAPGHRALANSIRVPTGPGEWVGQSTPSQAQNQNYSQAQPDQGQNGQSQTQPEPGHSAPPPQQAYTPGPPIDQRIIEEAQQRAQQILQEAQAAGNQMLMEYQNQAQQIMAQASHQSQAMGEQVQRQAHEIGMQNGYQEGLKAGGEAAMQQVYNLMQQVRDVYVQSIKQRQWLMASAEPELARLSVKVAEKILGQEIKTQPEAIIGIVKTALADVGDREEVSIRVNPADFDAAHSQKSTFERMVEGLKKFTIVADQAIDQGGCSIETNLGNIDARLNTQLATLRNAIEEQAKAHEIEIKDRIEAEAQQMLSQEGGAE